MKDQKAKSRFKQLDSLRNGVLARARSAAKLTIPSVLPDEGQDENSDLVQPYQSLGARGVNNLAAKLLLSLLPSQTAFFKFSVDPEVRAKADQDGVEADLEDALRRRENKIMKWIERSPMRIGLFNALRNLIVVGNALVHLPKDGRLRTFRFDQFVVVRDPRGIVTEVYIREEADPHTLPTEVVETCDVNLQDMTSRGKMVEIYTTVKLREGGKMVDYWQEINGIEVPNSRGQSKVSESPYIVLRWSTVDGESYGRGHVEEYIGDLRSLEGLSKSIVGFSAVAAKIIFLVHPNATTNIDDLTVADTGDFVQGALKDIEALQLDKYADFRVAKDTLDNLILSLSHAFLLQSGTVRDAERVTAEEIRWQAQELEDVLGGVFTIQTQELQAPLLRRIIRIMTDAGDLEKVPEAGMEPIIVTGFDALGRGHELNRIRAMFADIANTFGSEILAEYVKINGALKKFANGHNVDLEDIFKTDEEVQQERAQAVQQQAMAQMAQSAAGPVAGKVAEGAMDRIQAQ